MVEVEPREGEVEVTADDVRKALKETPVGEMILVPHKYVQHTCRNWAYTNGYRISTRKVGPGRAVVWLRIKRLDERPKVDPPKVAEGDRDKEWTPPDGKRFTVSLDSDGFDFEAEAGSCGVGVRLESRDDGSDVAAIFFKGGDGWSYAFSVSGEQTKVESSTKIYGPRKEAPDAEGETE